MVVERKEEEKGEKISNDGLYRSEFFGHAFARLRRAGWARNELRHQISDVEYVTHNLFLNFKQQA